MKCKNPKCKNGFIKRHEGGMCIDSICPDCQGTGEQGDTGEFVENIQVQVSAHKRLKTIQGKIKSGDYLAKKLRQACKIIASLQTQLAERDKEIERLRGVIKEIEDVSCGEEQIKADGDYNDSDGLKWIYDRIQAEQALQEKK